MSPRYLLEVLVDVDTWIRIKIGLMRDEDPIGAYQDLRGSGDWAGVRLLGGGPRGGVELRKHGAL